MAQSDPRGTAKIYDLSVFRRDRAARPGAVEARPVRLPETGGAWYHEAAIRDEERTRRT